MKAFISYNTKDKVLAGDIKESLIKFGITAFLAHDDIKPTQVWVERILDELYKSDIFLPLLTEEFHKSVWTSQEVGIAVGQGIFIVSLKTDTDPEGFLAQYQALKLKGSDLKQSALDIARLVSENTNLRRQFFDDIIALFENSNSFQEAILRAIQLNLFNGYSHAQVNAVIQATIDNDQIHSCAPIQSLRQWMKSRNTYQLDIRAQLLPSIQ